MHTQNRSSSLQQLSAVSSAYALVRAHRLTSRSFRQWTAHFAARRQLALSVERMADTLFRAVLTRAWRTWYAQLHGVVWCVVCGVVLCVV